MSRSIKKGPYVHPKLIKKVEALRRSGGNAVIKTWSYTVFEYKEFENFMR
mgnify:CR=1 FL=1